MIREGITKGVINALLGGANYGGLEAVILKMEVYYYFFFLPCLYMDPLDMPHFKSCHPNTILRGNRFNVRGIYVSPANQSAASNSPRLPLPSHWLAEEGGGGVVFLQCGVPIFKLRSSEELTVNDSWYHFIYNYI